MRPDLVSWRPGGASSSSPVAASGRTPASSYLTLTAALLALGLLIGFYWVVSSLVQRAETGRQQARLTVERQAVCGAFGNASTRELCVSTVATHVPANAVLRASYDPPSANARKRPLSAGMH
jgi:hypothetical protein